MTLEREKEIKDKLYQIGQEIYKKIIDKLGPIYEEEYFKAIEEQTVGKNTYYDSNNRPNKSVSK